MPVYISSTHTHTHTHTHSHSHALTQRHIRNSYILTNRHTPHTDIYTLTHTVWLSLLTQMGASPFSQSRSKAQHTRSQSRRLLFCHRRAVDFALQFRGNVSGHILLHIVSRVLGGEMHQQNVFHILEEVSIVRDFLQVSVPPVLGHLHAVSPGWVVNEGGLHDQQLHPQQVGGRGIEKHIYQGVACNSKGQSLHWERSQSLCLLQHPGAMSALRNTLIIVSPAAPTGNSALRNLSAIVYPATPRGRVCIEKHISHCNVRGSVCIEKHISHCVSCDNKGQCLRWATSP